MKFRPLHDRVVIERIDAERASTTIPSNAASLTLALQTRRSRLLVEGIEAIIALGSKRA